MVYKIRVILDAKETIFRDIEIKDKQTLWNLHLGIKSAFSLPGEELSSFYFSDDEWNEGRAVPLEDMSDDGDGEIMSDIYLNEEPVTVYAYYPYQSQVDFDPENIPVRISPDASLTKDYMYGIQASGQRAVNQISPVALLNMNHTLSLLSFQLRITPEAEGCFLLHAIQIGNTPTCVGKTQLARLA